MKFKCGETYDRWERRVQSWRMWFAWHPVNYRTDGSGQRHYIWLTVLWRRAHVSHTCAMGKEMNWEYKEIGL